MPLHKAQASEELLASSSVLPPGRLLNGFPDHNAKHREMPVPPLRAGRRGLDTALAVLVSADAVVTTYQVFAWNLPHGPRNLTTSIVAAISIIAPTMATGCFGSAADLGA
jgi:hypothetical protein